MASHRLGHRVDAELRLQPLAELSVIGQGTGAIARAEAEHHQLAQRILPPGVLKEELLRVVDRAERIAGACLLTYQFVEYAASPPAKPFANGERPFVVALRQKLAGVQLRRRLEALGPRSEALELGDVHPRFARGAPTHRFRPAPSALQLLTRFLAKRPAERSIVLCSRENLRLHLSRFAAPHRIVTLRADDLAFSRGEIEDIFAPLELEGTALDRIYEISQGWPIPVLFLARLASEGRHIELLERLSGIAFEELYEYLADQVIDALPPPVTAALFAAACFRRRPGRT